MPHRQFFHGLRGAAEWLLALVGVESAGTILGTFVTIGQGYADVLLSCVAYGVSTDVIHFLYWSRLGVGYREKCYENSAADSKILPVSNSPQTKGPSF